MGTKSEKRKGSKPASPTYPSRLGGYGRKGSASLAFSALSAVDFGPKTDDRDKDKSGIIPRVQKKTVLHQYE
jgi:hypothetical protein